MNRKSHLDIFLRVKRQHCCCVVRAMADRKSWQKKNPVQQITCNKVTRLDCSWGTLHCVWRETAAAFRRAQASTRWLNTQVGFRFFAFIFSLPWLGITCDGLRCIFPFFAMIFSLLIAAMRSAKWLLRLFSWFSACTVHTHIYSSRSHQTKTNEHRATTKTRRNISTHAKCTMWAGVRCRHRPTRKLNEWVIVIDEHFLCVFRLNYESCGSAVFAVVANGFINSRSLLSCGAVGFALKAIGTILQLFRELLGWRWRKTMTFLLNTGVLNRSTHHEYETIGQNEWPGLRLARRHRKYSLSCVDATMACSGQYVPLPTTTFARIERAGARYLRGHTLHIRYDNKTRASTTLQQQQTHSLSMDVWCRR